MAMGEKSEGLVSMINTAATAISRGSAVVRNTTTDGDKGTLSGAATAVPAGIAVDDSLGVVGTVFTIATSGFVKVKVGTAATQGGYAVSEAGGVLTNAVTGAIRNVYGRFCESGVTGDLVMLEVEPGAYWV